MCRAYGQRPSQVLRILNEEVALDFDLAMSMVHRMERDSHIGSAAEADGFQSAMLKAVLLED